jgi:hypothetical protein
MKQANSVSGGKKPQNLRRKQKGHKNQYFESQLLTTGYSTSVVTSSLLTQLCSNSGLLQAFPQAMSTVVQEGASNYLECKLKLLHMKVRLLAVGAESNAIAAGDSYNNLRVCIYKVQDEYPTSVVSALVTGGVTPHPRLHDLEEVLLDKLFCLPTQAMYTSGGTSTSNVPQVQFHEQTIPLNQVITAYSPTGGGAGAWSTDAYNYWMDIVSDSSVTPNPQLSWSIRIFYELQH